MRREGEKVRENRLRRMAERRGLRLLKSRRRDPGALGFGQYLLVPETEAGADSRAFKATLDDVERQLSRGGPEA